MKSLSLTRSIGIGLIALVALAGAVMLYTVNNSKAHADSAPAPAISNITVTPTDTGATFMWNTDQNANSQVLYGSSSAYNASSTLDTNSVMNHTSFIGGLSPNTLYHFQIQTTNGSGTLATSTDMTFSTASTSASSTPAISNVMVTPASNGATITWTTDIASSTRVGFGFTSSYGTFSTLDNTATTSHSVMLSALNSNQLYHFQALSGNAFSTDYTFTTLASSTATSTGGTGTTTSTTTPSSADIQSLIDEIKVLQAQIASISQQLQNALSILAGLGINLGGGTTPSGGAATISASNSMVAMGSSIDFGGRGFGHEETVNVMRDGVIVGTAHADGGGNFSTGAMSIPGPLGSHTYLFVGQTSGLSANITISVQ